MVWELSSALSSSSVVPEDDSCKRTDGRGRSAGVPNDRAPCGSEPGAAVLEIGATLRLNQFSAEGLNWLQWKQTDVG